VRLVGSGQFFVTPVRSGQTFMVFLEFGKFPLKMSNFSIFFPSGLKKIASGRVRKYLGQSRVGLLFTAGQK